MGPPARAIASRSGTAQWCSSRISAARGVVRDLLDDLPGVVVGERADAVGGRPAAGFGAGVHAFLALDAETDERADLAAEFDRLVLGEIAEMHHLDLSFRVLVHGERVDRAHGVALSAAKGSPPGSLKHRP